MEAARLVVEDLRDVLADLAKATAAGLAAASAVRRVQDGASRQVLRKITHAGALLRLAFLAALIDGRDVGRVLVVFGAGTFGLCRRCQCRLRELPAHELKLSVFKLLAGAAVLHATQVRHFDLELLDGEQRDLQCLLRALHLAAERGVGGKQFLRGHGYDCAGRNPSLQPELSCQLGRCSTTPLRAAARCARGGASRCLRAASTAVRRSARSSPTRPAAR